MSKRSRQPLFLLTLFLFAGVNLFLASRMIILGREYKEEMTRYVELLNFEARLLNAKEWVLGEWEAADRREIADAHYDNAMESLALSNWHSSAFTVSALLFLLIGFLAFRGDPHADRFGAIALVSVSALCLIVGIAIPMLEIGAYSQDLHIPLKFQDPFFGQNWDLSKDFQGRMYYYYQNKSVLELLGILFSSGNTVVAVSILGFSIVMPALKLALSLLMLVNRKVRKSNLLWKIVSKIGKWSMADVFVVACFLAYLSFYNMNSGIETEAHSLPGLYYFLAYCILSIASSMYLEKAIQSDRKAEREEALRVIPEE